MRAEIANPYLEIMEEQRATIIALYTMEPSFFIAAREAFIDDEYREAFALLNDDELIVALCFCAAMLDEGDIAL